MEVAKIVFAKASGTTIQRSVWHSTALKVIDDVNSIETILSGTRWLTIQTRRSFSTSNYLLYRYALVRVSVFIAVRCLGDAWFIVTIFRKGDRSQW